MIGKPTRGKAVDVNTAIGLYTDGYSFSEIGRRLGHRHGVIAYHIYRNKIPIHNPRQQRCPFSTDYLKNLYEQGLSTKEIGRRINTTPQAIYSRLLKAGVPLRTRVESLKLTYLRGRVALYGENHPNWTGGRYINPDGYVELRVNGHKVSEHRMVWESTYGAIPAGWVIHHLNGIKTDNRIENLIAVTRNSHMSKDWVKPYEKRIKELEESIKDYDKQVRTLKNKTNACSVSLKHSD